MPFSVRVNRYKPISCHRHPDEQEVQSGLATTPADLYEMTQHGVPISPANNMQFHDGYRTLPFEPGITSRRGVDIIDVWNAQMDVRKKLRDTIINTPTPKPSES